MSEQTPPDRDWRDNRGVVVLFVFAGLWLITIGALNWGVARHKLLPPDIAMVGWGIIVIAVGIGIEVRRRRRAGAQRPTQPDDERGAS